MQYVPFEWLKARALDTWFNGFIFCMLLSFLLPIETLCVSLWVVGSSGGKIDYAAFDLLLKLGYRLF